MRDLNEAYELQNPPSWKAKLGHCTAEATTVLRSIFNIRQQGVSSVSMYH